MPVIFKHGNKRLHSHGSTGQFSEGSSHHGVSQHWLRKASVQQTFRLSELLTNPKVLLKAFKRFYRKYYLKYLVPLFFVMLYMMLGAVLFYWLEHGAEEERLEQRRRDVSRETDLFMKRLEEISVDRAASRRTVKRKFVQEALDHLHTQLEMSPHTQPEWSLTSAMYFSGTLFTTIGFGDIACQTTAGRIMTVIYAIVGIPLMLMTLNDLGKFLYISIQDVLAAYNRLIDRIVALFRKTSPAEKVDLEQGRPQNNSAHTDAGAMHVSFNLHPENEEDLTLNLEASEDMDTAQHTRNSVESEQVSSVNPRGILQKDDTMVSLDALSGEDTAAEELLPQQGNPPRMPVLVAVGITVGWIFFCAALFMIWEDWTYGQSCYFMFISMSTIGLGDLSVDRRDLMVICFVFVIVGLSLVSMCISVIQAALEDLYKALLMKLLTEYQAKLAQGDHSGASMGMMKMWGNSKAAKYLMPMVSSETKKNVMQQIQEEARESGLEIPPIFENIDEKTGMPKILVVAEQIVKDKESVDETVINAIVKEADPTRSSRASKVPTVVTYDGAVQTEELPTEDKNDQTLDAVVDELAVQTDAEIRPALDENGVQTDSQSWSSNETQTTIIEQTEAETMTSIYQTTSDESQTEVVLTKEEELQTRIVDLMENESQTELIETKNERIQTPYPTTTVQEVQTDLDSSEPLKAPSTITRARRRIQRAFKKQPSHGKSSDHPRMSEWKDVSGDEDTEDEEDEDYDNLSRKSTTPESLDWDPIDGMHAEKQRPVKDLKRLFDKARGPPPRK